MWVLIIKHRETQLGGFRPIVKKTEKRHFLNMTISHLYLYYIFCITLKKCHAFFNVVSYNFNVKIHILAIYSFIEVILRCA